MNSSQIENALRSDSVVSMVFMGVFAADTPSSPKQFPAGYIANTEPHHMLGQHWVAFYCDGGHLECFDSFGNNPAHYSKHLQKWTDDEFKLMQSETLQSEDSTVCEQYCMFFILLRAYGFSYQDILSAFTRNTQVNDRFVCRFINRYFKLKTIVKDKKFLLSKLLKIK